MHWWIFFKKFQIFPFPPKKVLICGLRKILHCHEIFKTNSNLYELPDLIEIEKKKTFCICKRGKAMGAKIFTGEPMTATLTAWF